MQRITPYLFFVIAAGAIAMIAFDTDQSWQTEDVSPLRTVLMIGAAFVAGHLLRLIVTRYFGRDRGDKE